MFTGIWRLDLINSGWTRESLELEPPLRQGDVRRASLSECWLQSELPHLITSVLSASLNVIALQLLAYFHSVSLFFFSFLSAVFPLLIFLLFSSREGKTFIIGNHHTKRVVDVTYDIWMPVKRTDSGILPRETKNWDGNAKENKESAHMYFQGVCQSFCAVCACADSTCEYFLPPTQRSMPACWWLFLLSPVCVLLTLFLGHSSKTGYVSEQKKQNALPSRSCVG